MTAAVILKAATDAGIVVTTDGDGLMLDAAKEPDPALVERIRSHKAEILALLHEPAWSEEDWRALFDERAGIMEHDGGFSRAEAQMLATGELKLFRQQQFQEELIRPTKTHGGHRGYD